MAKRVAILADRRDNWHVSSLVAALEARGCTPAVASVRELGAQIGGTPAVASGELALDQCDAVLVRTLPAGTLEQVIFRMDALQRLERLGVQVINPARSLERSVDKYYTSTLLAEAGIPTPPTAVVQTLGAAVTAFDRLGRDVVAKPIFGSEGRGMVRLTDPDTAYRVFRAWELIGAVYYLQAFIPHGSRDLRAFTVGGRVVAAMERRADGWKTNFAQGAAVQATGLPSDLADLALAAARTVGALYAGVDLLPGEDGRVWVTEVNGLPGWRGLAAATGADVAGAIAELVLGGLA